MQADHFYGSVNIEMDEHVGVHAHLLLTKWSILGQNHLFHIYFNESNLQIHPKRNKFW